MILFHKQDQLTNDVRESVPVNAAALTYSGLVQYFCFFGRKELNNQDWPGHCRAERGGERVQKQ